MTIVFFAVSSGAALLVLILIQAVCVKYYHLKLANDVLTAPDRSYQPSVTVVLCLRGHDPLLEACLHSLLAQRYADFRLVCVFDCQQDPAWPVVLRFADDARLSMIVAEPHDPARSLKCNSLIHAFRSIHDPVTVLVDADTRVDADWLADLVAPLAAGDVVASSGNRWFLPPPKEVGSYVRYFWNMAAAPQMYVYQVTWGGSLALKTGFVRDSGLLDAWSKSLFEDASVPAFASRHGKQVKMIAGLLVPNTESVSVAGAVAWIQRQLLDTKMYHRCFPIVVLHAFSVAFALTATFLSMILALVNQQSLLAGVLAISLLLYLGFYLWGWWTLDDTARLALQKRGHEVKTKRPGGLIAWWAIGLTQVSYTVAVCKALCTRSVRWRGIDYKFRGPFRVEMVRYQEMQGASEAEETSI